jgi:hypothetical protein
VTGACIRLLYVLCDAVITLLHRSKGFVDEPAGACVVLSSWRRCAAASLPKSKAAEWLEEERTAEVYIYEDGHGFILGPFCINELQMQIEQCASACSCKHFVGVHVV